MERGFSCRRFKFDLTPHDPLNISGNNPQAQSQEKLMTTMGCDLKTKQNEHQKKKCLRINFQCTIKFELKLQITHR